MLFSGRNSRARNASYISLKETKNCLLGVVGRAWWRHPKAWIYPNYDITHKKLKSKSSQFFKSKLQDFPHL